MRALKISIIVFSIAALIGIGVVTARFVFKINPKDQFSKNAENSPTFNANIESSASQELDPAQMLPPNPAIAPPTNAVSADANLAAAEAEASQMAVSGCAIATQKPIYFKDWSNKGSVWAIAEGDSCGNALVKLLVKSESGRTLFSMTAPSRDFGVPDSASENDLSKALEKALPNSAIRAKAYPEWKNGDTRPFGTEFDQATYEKIRAKDAPIICLKLPSAPQTCIGAHPETGDIRTFSRG